jgi:hypothetical protein
MGVITWLTDSVAYWHNQWRIAWGLAELTWDAYMGLVQGTLEQAGVVKPVDENAVVTWEKRFVSRFVRHGILAVIGYFWLGEDFAVKLMFVLTCFNLLRTWKGK